MIQLRRKNRCKGYGLTSEQYEMLFTLQKGLCAVCGEPETRVLKRTGLPFLLCIDHNHETGEVRGLLCQRCNAAYGLLLESEKRIKGLLKYHKKHNKGSL